MTTVVDLLERSAQNFPDLPAVRWPRGGVELTWQELRERALGAAGVLAGHGVQPGDRVALLIGNDSRFPAAFYGALTAGAVAVPLSPRLTPHELHSLLQHSEARILVAAEEFLDTARPAAEGLGCDLLPAGELARPDGGDGFVPPPVRADMDAEVLYTSGTTGEPKGALMTHAACVATAGMAAYEFQMRARERVLILMPLTHSAPLNLFLLGAAYTGAQVVLDAFDPRDPGAMLEVCARERAQYLFAAPVAYLLGLRADPSRFDLSQMKRWIYGGAPMAPAQLQAVRTAYGGNFMGVYGLTESGPNGMALEPEEHDAHAGSLGWRPTVNTVVRVVDDVGRAVPDGTPGEIVMRTESAMRGYLKNPEATRSTLRDGWVYTGDMAVRDQDGYLWMLDRKKDLILSGGYNVFPKEVEEAVAAHPAVADVAVVGTPHPDWGETVTAVIVLRPGAALTLAELRSFLAERIASQKHPRRLEIVDALPRNPTGKVLRHLLRAKFTA